MTGSPDKNTNPYVGPRAFELEEKEYFHGRDEETAILAGLVMARRAILLFAQSGAGKSSLLKAGLIPKLNPPQPAEDSQRGGPRPLMRVLRIASVGGGLSSKLQAPVTNVFVFSALSSLYPDLDPNLLAGQTLAEGLAAHFTEETPQAQTTIPQAASRLDTLLIFDQFEELFTHYPERWREREGFFLQVRDCLEQFPSLHVLFSMREDYIAELTPYAHLLPDQLRSRFRMERLKYEAALKAVETPAARAGRTFAEGVAAELVKNLLRAQTGRKTGRSDAMSQYVEPVHLQIVCRDLWQKLQARSPQGTSIQAKDLQELVDVDRALIGFYEAILEKVAKETGIHQRRLRDWFDQALITPARTRGLAYRDVDETEGLANRAVDLLNDAYLIRASIRGGDTWYELVHDRLVEPILSANQVWRAGYANPLATPTQTWLNEGRSKARLLSRAALKEARQYAGQNPGELKQEEREFLEASQTAQRQARLLRGAAAIVALLLAALTTWALIQRAEAQENAAEARENARIASSRENAAKAKTQIERDPVESINLALKAREFAYTREAEDALRQTLYALRLEHRVDIGNEGYSLAYNPEGTILAAGDSQGVIHLFTQEGKQLREASVTIGSSGGEQKGITDLAFNPTGTVLASAHRDGSVHLWDAVSGKEIFALPEKYSVTSLIFTPGNHLITGSSNDKAILWESTDSVHYEDRQIFWHPGGVNDVVLSLDGRRLYTAGRRGDILLWDTATGKRLDEPSSSPNVNEGHSAEVTALAISQDGERMRMASGSRDKTVILWDVTQESPQVIDTFYEHTNTITDLQFSPNGRCLASASLDRSVKIRDATRGKLLIDLPGHAVGVFAVQFNPLERETSQSPVEICGWTLASLSVNGELSLWNIGATYEKSTFTAHGGPVEAAVFSPDGSRIATGSDDRTVRIWDAASGKELMTLEGHTDRINDLAFSPDGSLLATASWDGTIRLWNAQSGAELPSLPHEKKVQSLAFSPDGELLATACDDGNVYLWKVPSIDRVPFRLKVGDVVYGVSFSPDGKTLLASAGDGRIYLWDTDTYKQIYSQSHSSQEVYKAAFSPDGSRFASVSWDRSVKIWDSSSGEQINNPMRHADRVYGVKFSSDGKYLFTSSADGTVQMWEVTTAESVRTFPGPEFNSLDISPDGKTLVVGGEDGTTRLYTIDFEALLEAAKARLADMTEPAEPQPASP